MKEIIVQNEQTNKLEGLIYPLVVKKTVDGGLMPSVYERKNNGSEHSARKSIGRIESIRK
tara:strand:+ start:2271 stop:2450 length:180 start_codon:yes stop_codon:yes gene_type:complete